METQTDTANKKLTLLGVYKRDLAEAQRTIESRNNTITALLDANARLDGARRIQRAESDDLQECNEALVKQRDEYLKRSDTYCDLAVILGVIAAIETIALLVRWGVR